MPLNFSSVYYIEKNKTKHTVKAIHRYKEGEGKTTVWTNAPSYDEDASPVEYFAFTLLDDDTYAVTAADVTNLPASLVLPKMYNDKPVTQIGLVDTNGVYVGGFAAIVEGQQVISVIESVTIPPSITTIVTSAFSYQEKLTEVIIQEDSNLTIIGNYAFAYCGAITSITLPNSTKTVGDYAFNAVPLTKLSLGNVESVGAYAFASINLSDGVLYFPSSLKSVGNNAFPAFGAVVYSSSSIKGWCSIKFSSLSANPLRGGGVLALGYIGNMQTNIVIPDDVKEIKDYAFYGASIQTIDIPKTVTTMGYEVFGNCNNLANIYCVAESQPSGWNSNWNPDNRPVTWGYTNRYNQYLTYTLLGDDTYSVESKQNYRYGFVIPASYNGKAVTQIGFGAFKDRSIIDITIPSGVTMIADDAFYNCANLKEVIFSGTSSLTDIRYSAFYGCTAIKNIVIPDGVTHIRDYAFANCTGLVSITIPASVTHIGEYAFKNCTATINCKATEQPSGWNSNWNYSDCPVTWGYTG